MGSRGRRGRGARGSESGDLAQASWDSRKVRACGANRLATLTSAHHHCRTSSHSFGISGLSFYPFDSLAFLSSSYDHTLKLYDSNTLACSASFDLTSNVYSHALSPIAQHLLVACATQHPTVRLVDLRSGAATHSLAGHGGGAVLTVAWSPKDEHILASGGVDGTIRFWDVRRSAGTLGLLDMEDSVGMASGGPARRRMGAKAHLGPVNGVVWTDNGQFLVSTGHDERMRVWNMRTGANTLSNFGPIVRNKNLSTLLPLVVPRALVPAGQEMLFYPNEREILMCEIFEGTLLKRLRVPGVPTSSSSSSTDQSNANARNRITALAWRTHSIELLSAHADGMIRSWKPRTTIDALVDDAEREEDGDSEEEDDRKRKRKVLDDIHRDLTKRKVTYS